MSRYGFIAQDVVNIGDVATKVPTTMDNSTRQLVLVAGGDIFIGNSSVTTSGADEGLKLAAGEKLELYVAGPGANQIYARANPATTLKIIQNG